MKDILAKLKLDRHHRMERFGIGFFVLTFCMVGVMIMIGVRKKAQDATTLDSRVMYSSTFTTSITKNKGTVEGIFKSDDQTKVFLLLKFEDVSKVSTDAANYQLFLTGSSPNLKQTTPTCQPAASIYMFGSTGYMGIYLVDTGGFDKQILDLVVRCNTTLSMGDGTFTSDAVNDASFAKFDQFRIYFNPGGSDYVTADCLNTGDMDAFHIYESMVVRDKENAIREKLTADLQQMEVDLRLIDEYEGRLLRDNMQVPDAPPLIANDSVMKGDDGVYRLETDTVNAGGFDFNWQDGSILNGYLDTLANGMTYAQYFQMKRQETDAVPYSTNNIRWYDNNGDEFKVNNGGTDNQTIAINNDIQGLVAAWNAYHGHKRSYQCTDLRELLVLEVDARDVDLHYTVNQADGILTVY